MTKRPASKILLCLALPLWFSGASAYGFEALSTIRATAEKFALAQIDDEKLTNIEANAINMDPRLRLAKCERPLEAFTTANSRNIARTTVGVRCSGVKPWTVYVPVTISALAEVVYTARPLVRGEDLQVESLEIKQVPLDQLPANYLSNIDQLSGMALSRSVNSGVILTLNAIKPRMMIQRGQEVVILAKSQGIQVRMTGIALKNGASGDLIPIKNVKSGRTIEATVLNDSTVTVKM